VHRRVRPGGASRVAKPKPLVGEWDESGTGVEDRKRWCGPGYYWTRRGAYR
jgi:hypothetical protein